MPGKAQPDPRPAPGRHLSAPDQPRAVGRRIPLDAVDRSVRAWLDERFGLGAVVREHIGGMSAGCATSFTTRTGGVVFVKAVGTDRTARAVELFRHERQVLENLPPAPSRPALLDAFDDGCWVALVLEAVEGRLPDLGSGPDLDLFADVLRRQSVELTPPPPALRGLATAADSARRWTHRWTAVRADAERYAPAWVADHLGPLDERVARLPDRLTSTTLCHFDVRDDNLLIDDGGAPNIVDWGMARLGPPWTDLVLLACKRSTAADADDVLHRLVPAEAQDMVTDLLVAVAASQSYNAQQPAHPNLPTMAAFCADDAQRLWSLAAHRLHVA